MLKLFEEPKLEVMAYNISDNITTILSFPDIEGDEGEGEW